MQKICVGILLPAIVLSAALCFAEVRTTGTGQNIHIDTTGFPPDMKANYEIMKVKCVKCHSLERVVVAVKTGVAPISGQLFNQAATNSYGIKMLRKPDSKMNKQEVKATVSLMNYLLDLGKK